MAATDPANPYGGPLPWPPRGGTPRREAGAVVVLVDGHLRLLLAKGRNRLSVWPDPRSPDVLVRATRALARHLQRRRAGSVRLKQVNGEAVSLAPVVEALVQVGWALEDDCLALELPP